MHTIRRTIFVAACCVGVSTWGHAAEKTISRSELPPAVKKMLNVQSKGATIRRFTEDNESGQLEYEAEMITNGHSKDITIAPDGRLLEIEEQVGLDELPAAVRAALKAKAGKGMIAKVESITKQGRIVAYEAQVFTQGRHSEIQVGPHGEHLLHEE